MRLIGYSRNLLLGSIRDKTLYVSQPPTNKKYQTHFSIEKGKSWDKKEKDV
jgi:hypothetical protein